MSAVLKPKSKLIVCDGNEAAAWAVSLADVDMVAVYPITPQSSLVEYLAKFIADGRLNSEIVDVEGEHSVLSVLQGACLAGARTYTASCGPGLAFMFGPYLRTPGLRLPLRSRARASEGDARGHGAAPTCGSATGSRLR